MSPHDDPSPSDPSAQRPDPVEPGSPCGLGPSERLRRHEAARFNEQSAEAERRRMADEVVSILLNDPKFNKIVRSVIATRARVGVDQDDLKQELLTKVYEHLLKLGPTEDRPFDQDVRENAGWWNQVVRHQAVDIWRKLHWGESSPTSPEELPQPPDAYVGTDKDFEQVESLDWLRNLVKHLNQSEAAAIELYAVEGMRLKEIAELLGRAYTAVRQDQVRTTRKFKGVIGLTPAEDDVFRCWRRGNKPPAIAIELGLPEDKVRMHLSDARSKTDRFLNLK